VPKKYSHCWQNRIVLYSIFGRAWNPLLFQLLAFISILFCLCSFTNTYNSFLIINYEQFLLLLLVILLLFMHVIFIFITHQIVHLVNQTLKLSFNTLPPNRQLEGYHIKWFFRNCHFTYVLMISNILNSAIFTSVLKTVKPQAVNIHQIICISQWLKPLSKLIYEYSI